MTLKPSWRARLKSRFGVRLRVRNRLVAAFFALFVPFVLILGWTFNRTYREHEEAIIEEERDRAVLIAATFGDWIDRSLHLEELLSEYLLRNRGPGVLRLPFHDVLRLSPGVEEILYINHNGQVLHSTQRQTIGKDESDAPYVRAIASGRSRFLSDLFPYGPHHVFAVAHEVRQTDRQLLGLIVMLVRSDSMGLILGSNLDTRQMGAVVLTDSTGQVVFHSAAAADERLRRLREPASFRWADQPFVRSALGGGIGAARQFADPLARRVQVGTQVRVREFGWTAGSYVDQTAAFASVKREIRRELLVVFLIVGVAAAIAIYLARRITGPVRALKQGVQVFARGDLGYRIETGSRDELGELATAFNNMAQALQQREEGLTRSAESERSARAKSDALNEELAEEGRRLKILHAIAATATDNLDVTAVARSAASGLIGAFGLTQVSIWLHASDRSMLEPIAMAGYDRPPPPVSSDDERLAQVLVQGRSVFVEDVSEAGAEIGALLLGSDVASKNQPPSFVALPMRGVASISGLLFAAAIPARHFRWRLREFLATVADQLAIAIEKIRNIEQTEDLANLAQERASKLEAVVESMADGVVISDRDGLVIQINRAAASIFGLASRESGLVPHADLIELLDMRHTEGDRVRPDELPMARVINGETVTDMRLVIHRFRSGRQATLSVTGAPIRDVDGRVAGGVAVVRDITEAEKLARAKDDFLSIASHELKTPITAIKGMAQASQRLLDHGVAANPEFLDIINRQSDRLVRLINDLLDLSRIQTGRLTLQREPTDLVKLARSVVDHVQLQTDRHRIVLTTSSVSVMGVWDAPRLEQVIGNLLNNAVKYSPRGGEIDVHIQRHAEHVTLSVRDSGLGIPSEDLPQLFERFYRASNVSANNISGLGVGLYICREIVRRHGGEIRVHSREGAGATFEVDLPVELRSLDRSRASTLQA